MNPMRVVSVVLAAAAAARGDSRGSEGELPDATAPAAPPELVFRGGRLFDPESGLARPIGQLWIGGGRVLAEHPAEHEVPAGATIVDASGCTLLPGFFDLHVHVAVSGAGMGPGILLDSEEHLETHAAFGTLHAADLHHDAATVFALRDRTRDEPGRARLLAAGAAFTAPGGHGTQFGTEANVTTTVAEVGPRFDRLLEWKPDLVKGIVEHGGWAGLPDLPALEEAPLAEVGRRCDAAGLPLFVHVWSLEEAKVAVRAGADVLAHGVFLDPIDDELVAAMKARDVAYVPTLAVVFGARRIAAGRSPYTKERLDGLIDPEVASILLDREARSWQASWADGDEKLWLANLKQLFDAGIRVGTGTDCGNPFTPHGPALQLELALYVEAGLTPAQALRCATLESARLVGREKEFGSLAAGKVADVVVVRGDPLASIDALWRIERVFKAGREVDRAALRKRYVERARPPPARKVGEELAATVDDFDDGDLSCPWGGEWTALSDSAAPGGRSTAEVEASESGGSGTLLLTGELGEGFQYGAFAGATVQWDPSGRTLADASATKQVVVRARGSGGPWTLTIGRAAVRDYDDFSAPLPISEEWSEITVPLASFRQIGFGKSIPAAWNDVRGLTLQARAPMGAKDGYGAIELEVDWLRFQ